MQRREDGMRPADAHLTANTTITSSSAATSSIPRGRSVTAGNGDDNNTAFSSTNPSAAARRRSDLARGSGDTAPAQFQIRLFAAVVGGAHTSATAPARLERHAFATAGCSGPLVSSGDLLVVVCLRPPLQQIPLLSLLLLLLPIIMIV